MALKVVWSKSSEKELVNTLLYWKEKNLTNIYSLKLFSDVLHVIEILHVFPKLGFSTNYNNNRIIITSNYKLIYEVTKTQIKIKRFFDVRRNPKFINKL